MERLSLTTVDIEQTGGVQEPRVEQKFSLGLILSTQKSSLVKDWQPFPSTECRGGGRPKDVMDELERPLVLVFHLARPAMQIKLRCIYRVCTYTSNHIFQSDDFLWVTQTSMDFTPPFSLHVAWFSLRPAQTAPYPINQKSRLRPIGHNCRTAREDLCPNLPPLFFLRLLKENTSLCFIEQCSKKSYECKICWSLEKAFLPNQRKCAQWVRPCS